MQIGKKKKYSWFQSPYSYIKVSLDKREVPLKGFMYFSFYLTPVSIFLSIE